MSKPIIAVDIDEVLSASAPDFVEFSNERWGTNLRVEDYTEHWVEMWNIEIEEVRKRREVFLTSGIVGKYQPVPNALDALKQLCATYDIVLVTSRSIELESETRAWIDTHYRDVVHSVYFSGIYDAGLSLNSIVKTKSDVFAELKPVLVVDDHLKHCQAATDLGIPAVLFGSYKWNEEYDESDPLITRCNNWQEVLAVVAAL